MKFSNPGVAKLGILTDGRSGAVDAEMIGRDPDRT